MRRPATSGLGAVAPLLIVVLCGFDLPLVIMLGWSVEFPHFTLRFYEELFGTHVYIQVLWNTFRIAAITTVLCTVIGYPLAYWMHGLRPGRQIPALACVVLPFWVSILVRTYAWIVMLGNAGLVNRTLIALGVTTGPIGIIYNELGVVVGTVNVLLPYLVLPLLASMAKLDARLLQAAASLGASDRQVFRAVFLPLTIPATVAGAVLVFILTFGFYITPAVLGGGRVTMIANLLDLLINQVPNWELAAAISTILLAIVVAVHLASVPLRRGAE